MTERFVKSTLSLAADGKLSGAYMDGGNWGPYDVVVSDETLALTSPNGKDLRVLLKTYVAEHHNAVAGFLRINYSHITCNVSFPLQAFLALERG